MDAGVHVGALLVDVHMDVRPELRPRLAQPVAQARVPLVELVERLRDRLRLDRVVTLEPREERLQRRRQMNVDVQSITAASTDVIGGRKSAASDHVAPSSALAKSWPVLVPK